MYRSVLIIAAILIFVIACGSSVTESNKDADLRDFEFFDTGILDEGSEGIIDIWVYDSSGYDFGDNMEDVYQDVYLADEVFSDEGIEDTLLEDSYKDTSNIFDIIESEILIDSEEDIMIVDVVEDVYLDTGPDASEDTGFQYCKQGEKKQYQCMDGKLLDYCVCENKGCRPHCDKIGTESEGWYDCNGRLIKWASCAKCNVFCDAIGSKSEGWYSDCGGLIIWDQCAPDWFCLENPESRCGLLCSDSCDCPEEKPFCINGKCDDIAVISCSSDNMCPCGYYCEKSFCVEGKIECRSSCDCKDGYICVNRVCKAKLNKDCSREPCPCNSYCVKNPFGVDTCEKGCVDNCDCPSFAPICSGGICLSEIIFDCKGDDRNCPCGHRCVYGRCEKSDEYCDNSCECLNPLRQVCINDVCTGLLNNCKNDRECPCGEHCYRGSCTKDRECTTSCDCFENMICKNGICEQYVNYKCVEDNDCLCGNYCDMSSGLSGYCVTGCNDPCDCPSETPYCINGKCEGGDILPVVCKRDIDCRCNEVCINGKCLLKK